VGNRGATAATPPAQIARLRHLRPPGQPACQTHPQELDGVFGAERAGGWNALTWDTSVAHPAKDNLRIVGQLGVTGPLANKPIHVYGPPIRRRRDYLFPARVFAGRDVERGPPRICRPTQMIADLSRDPLGIALRAARPLATRG